MSRRTRNDDDLYRVVVEHTRFGHRTVYGPYDTLAVARAMRTRKSVDYRGEPYRDVTARIEKAQTVWEDVE